MKSVLLPLVLFLVFASSSTAQTVWNGPVMTFTKAAFADPTLASSQDRIVAGTWLTRANSRGLYNIAQEASYTHFSSPANTQWATGSLANYATLTYTDWETWHNSDPPSMVNTQAVLRLVNENIYIGIRFLSWGVTSGAGGSFSYERTTKPVAAPVTLVNFMADKKGKAIMLSWKTASEQNSSEFVIERSEDNRQFEAIGKVWASGNSSSEKAYQFTDQLPAHNNFYRLKTVDKDGSFKLSHVVSLRADKLSGIVCFPNPVADRLVVQTEGVEADRLEIFDLTGRTVGSYPTPADQRSFVIDVSTFKTGMYLLQQGRFKTFFVKQ